MNKHQRCLLCELGYETNEKNIHLGENGKEDDLACESCGACLYDNIGMRSDGHCLCGNCGAHVAHGNSDPDQPFEEWCHSFDQTRGDTHTSSVQRQRS